jgi:RNA-directed DNA polymerase
MDPLEEFALRIGMSSHQLTRWSHAAGHSHAYSTFEIAKRSGGTRKISSPAVPLRDIQRRLARVLADVYRPRSCVHGFTRGMSIVSNARSHARRRHILNVDLQGFFAAINFGRVRGVLMAKPFQFHPSIATTIARLACRDDQLPQGAPTSPILANMVCMRLDGELMRLAEQLGCRYTRYADDLTFSTNRPIFPADLAVLVSPPLGTHAAVGPALTSLINANGFAINPDKVRLSSKNSAQRVTGLIVNRFPNVPRKFVRQLRAMIHAWRTFGAQAAQTEYLAKFSRRHRAPFRGQPSFQRVVHGKLMFLGMVRGFSDPLYISLAKQCRHLDPALFSAVLDKDDALERSIWVLECEELMKQGTAFFLEGVGLVTCDHVVGPRTAAFQASAPSVKFPVTIVARDEHIDIAILSIDAPPASTLKRGRPDRLHHYSRIMIAGYPNYGFGDSLYKSWGTVTGQRRRHGLKYYLPSVPIAYGNSGGPVVDENLTVVGIAVRGVSSLADSSTTAHDAYGVLSINHIDDLRGS